MHVTTLISLASHNTALKNFSAFSRLRIAEAIHEYKEKTCVEFTPKTATDLDYVHILPDDGCYSLVGKVGKVAFCLYLLFTFYCCEIIHFKIF